MNEDFDMVWFCSSRKICTVLEILLPILLLVSFLPYSFNIPSVQQWLEPLPNPTALRSTG